MTSVNFNTNNAFQMKQNPDDYAKTYADKNGISIEEAREELKAKYGAPKQNMQDVSIFNQASVSNDSYYGSDFGSIDDIDWAEFEQGAYKQGMENITGGLDIKELFQKFMDFLRGGNGPQNEGDPQSHINPETGDVTGPQKEGDYNPMETMFQFG